MPSPKRFLSFVMLTLMAWKGTSAAPVEKQSQLEVRKPGGDTLAYTRPRPRRRSHHSNSSIGGLAALTEPIVMGAVNPLTTGVGKGVAGATAGTQQVTDLLGDAVAELAHVLGGVAANPEKGAGVTVSNAAPAVQDTVKRIRKNSGALGDVAKIVGGR